MLVISRREGESLMIGEDVEITVSRISDGSVKIAIDAPKSKSILRKELVSEIKEENKNACQADINVLKDFMK